MNGSTQQERLRRYMAGELKGADRRAFEQELLRSPELMESAYDDGVIAETLSNLRRRPHVARTGSSPAPGRWKRWALPVAALLAFAALGLWQLQTPDGGSPPGAGTLRGSGTLLMHYEPAGNLDASPGRFRWGGHPGAARYRFELFDDQSRSVFVTSVTDTALIATVVPIVPGRGAWQVHALDGLGSILQSTSLVSYDSTQP